MYYSFFNSFYSVAAQPGCYNGRRLSAQGPGTFGSCARRGDAGLSIGSSVRSVQNPKFLITFSTLSHLVPLSAAFSCSIRKLLQPDECEMVHMVSYIVFASNNSIFDVYAAATAIYRVVSEEIECKSSRIGLTANAHSSPTDCTHWLFGKRLCRPPDPLPH